MAPHDIVERPSCPDVEVIGLPRALLWYRYGTLWTTFFESLGKKVVTSRPTDRDILERGEAISGDECCLASKIFMGHVDSLIGSCDALFIPSMRDLGLHRSFCTKFQSLPDLTASTFADRNPRILSCLIARVKDAEPDEAHRKLARELGASGKEAKRAYKEALRALERVEDAAADAQKRTLQELREARTAQSRQPSQSRQPNPARGTAILIAAHSYIAHDPFLGGEIARMLDSMGATVLYADETDRRAAYRASEGFSQTMPWIVNREIAGSIELLRGEVDGIVLASAFPCGPDSMTSDAIVRCLSGTPVLNLTIDSQSGTAGLETRLESFVDILRYQKRGGYVHELAS